MVKANKESFKGYFLAIISAISYGLIPLFALPLITNGMQNDSILFLRFSIASICIGIVMIYKKITFKVTFAEFLTLCSLGFFFSISSMFLFQSYKYLSSGLSTSILFIYPIMVALFMRLIFKEKLKPITFFCMIAAILGVFILYWGGGTTVNTIGVIYALLSGLSYSFYIIIINKSNVKNIKGIKITFYSMLITAIIFFVKSMIYSDGIQIPPTPNSWINLILLGIIATAVSCGTLADAIKIIGSTNTAVLGAIDPVTAILIGIFVFDEPFTFNLAIGMILIIGSVTIMIIESRFREFVQKLIK